MMSHLLRYTWSVLLIVAAILSPDLATTITLLIAGGANVILALLRQKRLTGVTKNVPSVALERSLARLQKQLIALACIAELIIFIALLLNGLDITVARNYALLVLVALAPLGLELELAAIIHAKHHKFSETVRTAVGYAAEDAHALLAVIGLSLLGTLVLHIPPALSTLQLLVITCIARPLLSGRALQATPHKVDQAWRVFFTSTVVYGSFVFFFIRHYLEPRYADTTNAIVWQATTVALVTFIACQAATLIFNPQAPKVTAYRSMALLAIVLFVVYWPGTQDYFMTAGLAAADWAWVIIAGLVYISLLLLRQQVSLHSRKSVLSLHRAQNSD